MSEIKARFAQKHDVEANWNKATNFIPKAGEIIVYDADDIYSYPRIKVGDGTTKVNDLPFANSPESEWVVIQTQGAVQDNNPTVIYGQLLNWNEAILYKGLLNPARLIVQYAAVPADDDTAGYLTYKGYDAPTQTAVFGGVMDSHEYTMMIMPSTQDFIMTKFPWNPLSSHTSYTIFIDDMDMSSLEEGVSGTFAIEEKRVFRLDPARIVLKINNQCLLRYALTIDETFAVYTTIEPLPFSNMDGGQASYPISDITVTVDLSSGAWEAKRTTISVATKPTSRAEDVDYALVATDPGDFDALGYSEKVTINPAYGRISAQAFVVTPDMSSPDQTAINIDSRGIIVEAGNTKSLGSLGAPWDHVYAATFVADDGHDGGKFIGDLQGTATNATADAQGRNIVNTYATKEEVFITTDDIDTICGTTIEVATSEVKF